MSIPGYYNKSTVNLPRHFPSPSLTQAPTEVRLILSGDVDDYYLCIVRGEAKWISCKYRLFDLGTSNCADLEFSVDTPVDEVWRAVAKRTQDTSFSHSVSECVAVTKYLMENATLVAEPYALCWDIVMNPNRSTMGVMHDE